MQLNRIEQKGLTYIVDNFFTPVVDEYDGKIESLLKQNQELQTKVEQKLERIRKNRLLKKAAKSEMIAINEDRKNFK